MVSNCPTTFRPSNCLSCSLILSHSSPLSLTHSLSLSHFLSLVNSKFILHVHLLYSNNVPSMGPALSLSLFGFCATYPYNLRVNVCAHECVRVCVCVFRMWISSNSKPLILSLDPRTHARTCLFTRWEGQALLAALWYSQKCLFHCYNFSFLLFP